MGWSDIWLRSGSSALHIFRVLLRNYGFGHNFP